MVVSATVLRSNMIATQVLQLKFLKGNRRQTSREGTPSVVIYPQIDQSAWFGVTSMRSNLSRMGNRIAKAEKE